MVKHMFSFLDRRAFQLFVIWLVFLFVLYSTLAIVRHQTFQSGGFDLGIFDQTLWQYSQFLFPYNTIKERFILGDHLTLTLPLFAPLYWVWSNVLVLLLLQAAGLCISAVAIYKLCLLRKLPTFSAFCIGFVYSLFYGIQFMVYFDFHPVAIGVGLLPWVAYFLETKQKRLLVTSIVLLLLTQENMGIALASLGIFYIFKKPFIRQGFIFIILGITTSLMLLKVTDFLSPVGYSYQPIVSGNPLQIIADFFNSEEKRQVWLYSFSWFSFLPLLSPGAILAVTLDLGQYFITGPLVSRMWSPYMHHRAILAVFLALGTIDVLQLLQKRFKFSSYAISLILVGSTLFQQYYFHFPLNKLYKKAYWHTAQWMRDNRTIINSIPKDTSIAAQQNLVPHISQRKEIYLLWPRQESGNFCGNKKCWLLHSAGKPEYFFVNTSREQNITQLLEDPDNFNLAVVNMEKNGMIKLEKKVGDARLYKVQY